MIDEAIYTPQRPFFGSVVFGSGSCSSQMVPILNLLDWVVSSM
jgi:hypothetical protein